MVFEHPAVHELAATVDDAGRNGRTPPTPVTSRWLRPGLSADELAAVTSMFATSPRRCAVTATDAKVAVEDVMALSPLQQGLFSLAS